MFKFVVRCSGSARDQRRLKAIGTRNAGICRSKSFSEEFRTSPLALIGSPSKVSALQPLRWPDVLKIEPCYAYRHQLPGESAEDYASRSAGQLQQAIDEYGAENIAAFFAEPVVGATLGAVPAVPGYFRQIREICDRNDILLVLDEVMAGCGRTGSWFAFEQEGVLPDIVTVAKGLGAGYQPIGATIVRGFIHDAIVERFGAFAHGHTYVGHATAAAAGLAVEHVIERDGLLQNVVETGGVLAGELNEAFGDHPHVGEIRGRGFFLGIELVSDRDSRAPVPAGLGLPEKLRRAAMQEGLICYPGGGTADGVDGAHVLLAPPYIYERNHVDELVTKLQRTMRGLSFT